MPPPRAFGGDLRLRFEAWFFDLTNLSEKGLVDTRDGLLRVSFAAREGALPLFTLAPSREREIDMFVARLRILMERERVRMEDVLVLTQRGARAEEIAAAIRAARLHGVESILLPMRREEKDAALCRTGAPTVSTVASAKGYDAFVRLLASANEFTADVRAGRRSTSVARGRSSTWKCSLTSTSGSRARRSKSSGGGGGDGTRSASLPSPHASTHRDDVRPTDGAEVARVD
jgi:hypothetical protein